MQQLVSQLGINWQLLLSQAVNFALLLIVLRIFVYKPVLKLLHDRREKIEGGLMKAEEAEKRLHEVDQIGKGKIKEAEHEAINILKRTETEAKTLEEKLLAAAKAREEEAVRERRHAAAFAGGGIAPGDGKRSGSARARRDREDRRALAGKYRRRADRKSGGRGETANRMKYAPHIYAKALVEVLSAPPGPGKQHAPSSARGLRCVRARRRGPARTAAARPNGRG